MLSPDAFPEATMAIVRDVDLKRPDAATHFGSEDADCFFCGERLGTPFVLWQGTGPLGRLVLHPACVLELNLRISRDVHAIQHELRMHVELVHDKKD